MNLNKEENNEDYNEYNLNNLSYSSIDYDLNNIFFINDNNNNKNELSYEEKNYLENINFEIAFNTYFNHSLDEIQYITTRKTEENTTDLLNQKRCRDKNEKDELFIKDDLKEEKVNAKIIIGKNNCACKKAKGRKKEKMMMMMLCMINMEMIIL